jgi:hypothetical protein
MVALAVYAVAALILMQQGLPPVEVVLTIGLAGTAGPAPVGRRFEGTNTPVNCPHRTLGEVWIVLVQLILDAL